MQKGNEIPDVKMGVFAPRTEDDPGYNIRERSAASARVCEAWAAARRAETTVAEGKFDEERFYATLYRPEMMRAIRNTTSLPDGSPRDAFPGLIYAWSTCVHAFEEYCLSRQRPELSQQARAALSVVRATERSEYTMTSRNTVTKPQWPKQRTIMKQNFGDLYLALSRLQPGELATVVGDILRFLQQDVANLTINHGSVDPTLVVFENQLMKAALRPYDRVPPARDCHKRQAGRPNNKAQAAAIRHADPGPAKSPARAQGSKGHGDRRGTGSDRTTAARQTVNQNLKIAKILPHSCGMRLRRAGLSSACGHNTNAFRCRPLNDWRY